MRILNNASIIWGKKINERTYGGLAKKGNLDDDSSLARLLFVTQAHQTAFMPIHASSTVT